MKRGRDLETSTIDELNERIEKLVAVCIVYIDELRGEGYSEWANEIERRVKEATNG